jgi:hypothetical protein
MGNVEMRRDGSTVEDHVPGSRGDDALNDHLARIVVLMVEMEQGLRPVSSLDDQASPLAARRIRKLVQLAAQGRRRAPRRTAPASLVRATSFHPSAGVTEGVVVLSCDGRVRAYSVRLEQQGERWWIVDLAPPEGGLTAAITAASRTGTLPIDAEGRRWSSGRSARDVALRMRDGSADA